MIEQLIKQEFNWHEPTNRQPTNFVGLSVPTNSLTNFNFLIASSSSFFKKKILWNMLCLCAAQLKSWLQTDLGRENSAGCYRQGLGKIGSITSRCSGKLARTHPPKERLDACDFLCWLKPTMLPAACSFSYGKDGRRKLTHRMSKRFRRPRDTRRNFRVGRNTTFCSIVCCELFF